LLVGTFQVGGDMMLRVFVDPETGYVKAVAKVDDEGVILAAATDVEVEGRFFNCACFEIKEGLNKQESLDDVFNELAESLVPCEPYLFKTVGFEPMFSLE
jgi:hypothetical protein